MAKSTKQNLQIKTKQNKNSTQTPVLHRINLWHSKCKETYMQGVPLPSLPAQHKGKDKQAE